jgi:hypothetical protein
MLQPLAIFANQHCHLYKNRRQFGIAQQLSPLLLGNAHKPSNGIAALADLFNRFLFEFFCVPLVFHKHLS